MANDNFLEREEVFHLIAARFAGHKFRRTVEVP